MNIIDNRLMEQIITNEQRRYLGLEPIGSQWEVTDYINRQNNDEHVYLLFDGDIIRRKISITPSSYQEVQLQVRTAENHTLVLPKTKRRKPKKRFLTGKSITPVCSRICSPVLQ